MVIFVFLLRRGLLGKIFMIFVKYNGIDGAKCSLFEQSFFFLSSKIEKSIFPVAILPFPSLCGHLFITALF